MSGGGGGGLALSREIVEALDCRRDAAPKVIVAADLFEKIEAENKRLRKALRDAAALIAREEDNAKS